MFRTSFLLFVIASLFLVDASYSQAIFCQGGCNSDIDLDCFSCDPSADLPGFYDQSVFPTPGIDPAEGTIICGIPTQFRIGYTFIAGSPSIEIDISYDCPEGGIDIMLLDGCSATCLDSDGGCFTTSASISYNDLVVGSPYSIVLDGCIENCDFSIDNFDMAPFETLVPSSLSAYSECKGSLTLDNWDEIVDCEISESITVCPGETVSFRPRHIASEVNTEEYDGECSYYAPSYPVEFIYEFDGNEIIVEDDENAGGQITVTMPDTDIRYETQICLIEVSNPNCGVDTSNEICLDINVVPIEEETYSYGVCLEELSAGWNVPFEEDDPNGDGIYWQGPEIFDVSEVLLWDDGCQTFEMLDQSCSCPLRQTMCIQILGDVEPHERTVYMYDCQFDEDGEYEWTLPTGETNIVESASMKVFYELEEFSRQSNWEGESCDSLLSLTVITRSVEGNLSPVECDDELGFGLYEFEINEIFLNAENNLWPAIDEAYTVEFINCDDGTVLASSGPRNYLVEDEEETLCVSVTYEFNNGIWGDSSDDDNIKEEVMCDKIFGPYRLTAGCEARTSNCPTMDQIWILQNGTSVNYSTGQVVTLEDQDVISLRLDEDILPSGGTVEWWISDSPDFIPRQEGTRLGAETVEGNWVTEPTEEAAPELLAISYRDPFDASEYFIVGTGGGLFVDNMYISLDNNCDTSCPADCRDDILGADGCAWKKSDKVVLRDCPNIIAVGPGDYVPPNNILVVYVNEEAENIQRSAEALCSLDGCIYVTFSACSRCLDGFADAGTARYSLFTDDNIQDVSTISYVAQPDGGSVNSQGEYAFERDSLPKVLLTRYDIDSDLATVNTTISCSEYSGRQYIRGVIVSEFFDATCCDPFTDVITLDINCIDPQEDFEDLIEVYPWLAGLNLPCVETIINVYEIGIYTYLHIETADSSQLYFQDGTLYCTDALNFDCVSLYNLGAPIETQVCDDETNPSPDSSTEIFSDFPFIENLVDTLNCEGVKISVYEVGVYTFIHIETVDGGVLYFEDGTLYCTDATNFSCIDIYGLSIPVSVWNCGNNAGVTPTLFADYPWLENVVDRFDCGETSVDVYQSGNFLYFFVDEGDGVLTMYNAVGQFYCQDGPGFSCLEAYGITQSDFVERWECLGFGGVVLDQRAQKEGIVEYGFSVYPNPTTNRVSIVTDLIDYDLSIHNMTGEHLRVQQDGDDLDLSTLESGVYLIVLRSELVLLTQRIVKI